MTSIHEPKAVEDVANAKVAPKNKNEKLMKAYSGVVGP